jgi:hypothetical protein
MKRYPGEHREARNSDKWCSRERVLLGEAEQVAGMPCRSSGLCSVDVRECSSSRWRDNSAAADRASPVQRCEAALSDVKGAVSTVFRAVSPRRPGMAAQALMRISAALHG